MTLGPAFQMVNGDDAREGNYVFWIKPGTEIAGTHFNPTQEPSMFWQSYLDDYYKNEEVTRTHICYKNSPKNHDWLSGITLDSDIYVRINEIDYIVKHTFCQDHEIEEVEDCEECEQLQQKTKTNLTKASNRGKIPDLFKKYIEQYPFIPLESDIKFVRDLCEELFDFIKERFTIPYDNYFTEDVAGKYIILCRDNISLLKEAKTDKQGNNYYRYGFHIYFFNIKLEPSGKKYISDHFQMSEKLERRLGEYFPTTKNDEVFDRSPLIGTTSLPLSSTSDKVYSYFYEENQMLLISRSEETQQALNPFGGKLITLKPKYIEHNIYDLNLVQLIQKEDILSYEQSILFILSQLKEFGEDFQFMILLKTYGHPSYAKRYDIIKNLYAFLFDERKVQYSLLTIQMCFYLIMCENVETICQPDYFPNKEQNWITLNKSRNRYPLKIVEYVLEFHEKEKRVCDKTVAYGNLFDMFNKYKLELGLENECIEFDPVIEISYRNFKNFVNIYQNGTVSRLFPIYLRQKKQPDIVNDILFEYVYSQLEHNIVVSFGKFYFFDASDSDVYDNNKYHLIEENVIEGKMSYILRGLKDGITGELKVMQKDEEKEAIFEEYTSLSTKDRNDFLEDLKKEQEEYVCQCEHYTDLFNLVCSFSEKAKSKTATKEILIEKLAAQGYQEEMDKQQNCFGVYNGILSFDNHSKSFELHEGKDAKKFFISKSTLFRVREEFLDENSKIITPDKLPNNLKQIYDEIDKIYKTIYRKGKDIEVLYWEVCNIISAMLDKNTPGESLLISFGTGSDGKTTAKEAICCALGQGQSELSFNNVSRKIVSSGYSSQVASTILEAKQNKPNEHGTGGYIELQDNYFALMAELSSQDPLVPEAIKNMLAGTQLTTRRAYDKDVKTFENTCFLELETNNYPTFSAPLDGGLVRRVLFYEHDVKFVKKTVFENLDSTQLQNYELADETIRNKLNADPDYIDVLGFYLLNIYSQHNHEKGYVPNILLEQSEKFFNASLIYMKQCMSMVEKSVGDCVVFSFYEKQIRNVVHADSLSQQRKNAQDLEKLAEDHLKTIKDNFMESFVCRDIKTGQERIMSLNEFEEVKADPNSVILIKDYVLTNEQLRTLHQKILDEFNIYYK